MSKEIYISSTPHETRLAIVEKDELTEIYYERENEYTLAGSIYNGRVTRVLPGMQSSFVDIGLERDAFLYITDFMEEAGDAADFEAVTGEPVAGSGGGRREGGRSEGGRGEGGRSEGGRERGRGRREGSSGSGERRGEEAVSSEAPTSFADADEAAPGEAVQRETAEGEVGEGAPGADGSRRWRGRRGRRRGRGANGEARSVVSAGGEAGSEIADENAVDLEASSVEVDEFAAPTVVETPRETSRGREGARDGGRDRDRGRGGRDRDRGHGERSGRERGERPRREDAGESVDVNAVAVEPIILPGESLSKYCGGSGSTEVTKPIQTNESVPKPSTEFSLAAAWDGGAVLPGETIRRREPSASAPRSSGHPSEERRSEGRGERGRDRGPEQAREGGDRSGGSDRRRDRDSRRGGGGRDGRREERPRREDRAQAAAPSGEMQKPITPVMAPAAEVHETALEKQEIVAHAQEPVAHEQEAVFEETVHEYEPGENAAASFRVDPTGASEFRKAAPVEDPGGLAVEEHEVTELQPTGEMVSEVHVPVVGESHVSVEDSAAVEHSTEDTNGFAPGDGQLEEELMDDEEVGALELHASAFDDDTEEEETLEGAADLGSMIRDMSIDSITRSAPAESEDEEEDDFDIDEEELEEDELAAGDESEDDADADDVLSGDETSEGEENFAEATTFDEKGDPVARETRSTEAGTSERRPRDGERRGRRDGRRGGRDRGLDRGGDRSSGSERNSDRGGDRSSDRSGSSRDRRGMANSRHSGGGGRERGGRSMQSTNLPAISDLLKPGQEVLVQIAKEPIAKKGARITSHIALPGRFLVFMPTVSHTGVSRKIESSTERRRLKDILLSEKGEAAGGFIVRTAASGASEEDLRSDLRFLLNMWTDIKARSESSKSPALIYHDLNLIERILRDQVTDNFSAIWVDTEAEYERVLRFLQRFQPSLIRRVKLYGKETPLFEQFGITEEINKALRSKVWLKSGGSIVINQTEALVAIDINTGKFVGKTARLEDTIVKTNLDAIPEIVRQMRLRDLGGIIIIDFIDMDERKNRNKVMAALEEELKKDRAPSKVLQFNDFGLVAITRKRVKQTLERTLSMTCGVCQGTGMTKAPVTVCNEIYIELRKMHKHMDKGDLMLRVHPEVTKQLKLNNGKWLQDMEELSGKTILLKSDPSLHPEQFDMH